ncbi:MAG: hypothetical protein O9325_04855 [Roseomonas sp.]|nr:hypothetical protein [Roseomonas sp.]
MSHHPVPDPAEVAAFYATRYRVAYKGTSRPRRCCCWPGNAASCRSRRRRVAPPSCCGSGGRRIARPAGAGPALAERLARQVATEGRALAYLLSGSPITRRIARLRRNIDEWRGCLRHDTVRGMADAVLDQAARTQPGFALRGEGRA